MLRKFAKKIAVNLGLKSESKDHFTLPKDLAPHVRDIYNTVQPYTMTSPERVNALVRSVEYLERSQIPGDIVECGVWRGGSMMAVAKTLLRLEATPRNLLLFDTFEGMPPPDELDVDLEGRSASAIMDEQEPESSHVWAVAQFREVKQNMEETRYPTEHVTYIKGKVEETLPKHAPDQIALLRLDTDWYASTRHELIHLYPRLVPGGIVIIDDYGHWEGARKAVDEYIEDNNLPLFLCRIDYSGRLAVKWTG